MAASVRAHFDGQRVVLDEPAAFLAGDELVVSLKAAEEAQVGASNASERRWLDELIAAQGASFMDLDEAAGDFPPPEPGEGDILEAIEANRMMRRQWAAEKAEQEEPW